MRAPTRLHDAQESLNGPESTCSDRHVRRLRGGSPTSPSLTTRCGAFSTARRLGPTAGDQPTFFAEDSISASSLMYAACEA